jgi:hypothetical protein
MEDNAMKHLYITDEKYATLHGFLSRELKKRLETCSPPDDEYIASALKALEILEGVNAVGESLLDRYIEVTDAVERTKKARAARNKRYRDKKSAEAFLNTLLAGVDGKLED